jgi:hypothetical protein
MSYPARREKYSSTHLEVAEVHFCGCRNYVGLVDPPERYAVDLEGTGYEEEARLELLEEDDTLSAEAAREQDEDGAGGDGRAE